MRYIFGLAVVHLEINPCGDLMDDLAIRFMKYEAKFGCILFSLQPIKFTYEKIDKCTLSGTKRAQFRFVPGFRSSYLFEEIFEQRVVRVIRSP